MTNKKILIYLVVFALIIIAISQLSRKNPGIKVGVIIPLSGDAASLGEKIKRGIDIAATQSNIDNKVNFTYEDGGIEPKKALTAYQKLSSLDKINYFIGPFGPDQIMSIAPVLKDNDTMLGVSLCEDRFKQYPQIFCTYPSIPDQIKSSLPVIKDTNLKSIALITPKGVLGTIVEGELTKAQTEIGFNLKLIENIKQGDTDFRALITKVKALGVDGVFIASLPDEGYRLIKQLRELKFEGKILAEVDFDENILKDYGIIAEGIYLPGHISPIFDESFTQTYKAKYNENPDLYVALGHSIGITLINALKNGSFSKEKLIGQKDTKTAIIGFEFRSDRTISVPVESLVFKEGRIQRLSK